MLRNLSCQLLARAMLWLEAAREAVRDERGMLRMMSHDVAQDAARDAAHDALQPLLPNLSCPLLRSLAGFSCGSVFRSFFAVASCHFRAM